MSDEAEDGEEPPKKSGKMGLIIGLVLALAGGGGGFFAVSSGMILAPAEDHAEDDHHDEPEPVTGIAYIDLDPVIVTLTDQQVAQHLRFRANLEVATAYQPDVELLVPRIMDILNSYLRALKPQDFRDAMALTRLRSQMLRRVQVVVGEGRVSDLLVMEFVLN